MVCWPAVQGSERASCFNETCKSPRFQEDPPSYADIHTCLMSLGLFSLLSNGHGIAVFPLSFSVLNLFELVFMIRSTSLSLLFNLPTYLLPSFLSFSFQRSITYKLPCLRIQIQQSSARSQLSYSRLYFFKILNQLEQRTQK